MVDFTLQLTHAWHVLFFTYMSLVHILGSCQIS